MIDDEAKKSYSLSKLFWVILSLEIYRDRREEVEMEKPMHGSKDKKRWKHVYSTENPTLVQIQRLRFLHIWSSLWLYMEAKILFLNSWNQPTAPQLFFTLKASSTFRRLFFSTFFRFQLTQFPTSRKCTSGNA